MPDSPPRPNPVRFFASDNASGIHPDVLEAIAAANGGHALAYGHDEWTARAQAVFRNHFGDRAEVFPVFSGTGANVVALQAVLEPYQCVICADVSHLHHDECGALERIAGCKVVAVSSREGRISPEAVRPYLAWKGDVHHPQPRVISIAQPTEVGTVYSLEDLRTLAAFAHDSGLLLHVDGARLANAAVALGQDLGPLIRDSGVDLLSLGGTKCGLLGAEAVVILRPDLAARAPFLRKQSAQLASKMRFIAAQLEALYGSALWRDLAGHANAMARRLADRAARIRGVEIAFPVQTNAVFARLPLWAIGPLQERFFFHVWDVDRRLVRWMTSWDATEEDVDEFARALREVMDAGPA